MLSCVYLTILQIVGPMCHYVDPETQHLCAAELLRKVLPKHVAANAKDCIVGTDRFTTDRFTSAVKRKGCQLQLRPLTAYSILRSASCVSGIRNTSTEQMQNNCLQTINIVSHPASAIMSRKPSLSQWVLQVQV